MSLIVRLTLGAAIMVASFWITLQVMDYLEGGRGPKGSIIFDEGVAVVFDLTVTRNSAMGPDGKRNAMLLEDNSPKYGVILEDVPVKAGDAHAVSIDIKAGTSPMVQLVMAYLGGSQRTYYVYVNTQNMTAIASEGDVSIGHLGDGWYRVKLAGANDRSGNTTLRLSLYPRHGKPEDTGSLYAANARLDP